MSIWRRIFGGGRRRRTNPDSDGDSDLGPDERLDQLLRELRDKLEKFLVIRHAPPGELPTGGKFALIKTNDQLFRLEAAAKTPGGASVSILINTQSYLTRQKAADGGLKIQGLLHMSEVGLCRALQSQSLGDFLSRAEPPGESSLPLFQALLSAGSVSNAGGTGPASDGDGLSVPEAPPQPSDLLRWSPFDADQMIARNTPNVLAHVLVHATPELEEFLRNRFSRRLRLLLIDELERLAFPASRPEMNPGSRNRGLLQFEEAILEFRRGMADYLLRLERDRIRADLRRSGTRSRAGNSGKERLP
ncbi:MAG: hypothetical protein NXI24_11970 [bacterium]|nr:hypothetical protein [bacterium]